MMRRRIRVFEVTKSTAGVAEYVRWLATELDKNCFEITVACLSENGEQFAAELSKIEGVKAFPLAMNRYSIDPLSDTRVALELAQHMEAGGFDLVHAHASKAGLLARLAAKKTGTPVIYSPHCFSFHKGVAPWKASLLAMVERWLANLHTARIVLVAESEKNLASKYHVGHPEQFVTICTGVDARPYDQPVDQAAQKSVLGIPPEARVVGTVGRLNEQKAPFDFVRTVEIVADHVPDVHFLWVGEGPLLEKAMALSYSLGLGDRMHFAGQRQDVPACMAVMDCFLLTSHWEGFPIVILEAMAAGLPVVATHIDGTRDAVQPGFNGLLAPSGDAAALASHVETVLQNPALARQFASAGRARVLEEFYQERMIEDITRVYQEVAGESNRE